jgi:hypothetical protein
MRLTPLTRAVAVALAVFLGTALVWWLVGYQIGKGLMEELDAAGTWRQLYGFQDGGFARLLLLATIATLAAGLAEHVGPAARWPALAAAALAVGFLQPDREPGAVAGTVLLVLAAGAGAELEGRGRLVTGLALAVAVAFAFALDTRFGAGQLAIAVLLRGLFFFTPLLLGPSLAGEAAAGRLGRHS